MNANAFRHLYDYHFTENRTLWDRYIALLTREQFAQAVAYSHGSVQNQIIHLISVDDTWFCGLRGMDIPKPLDADAFADRQSIRTYWDSVETKMLDYLATLRDEMLFEQPLADEDQDLFVWQVLLHVVNHGTDHRAQMLRMLNDFGIKTISQDYIFHAYDFPID